MASVRCPSLSRLDASCSSCGPVNCSATVFWGASAILVLEVLACRQSAQSGCLGPLVAPIQARTERNMNSNISKPVLSNPVLFLRVARIIVAWVRSAHLAKAVLTARESATKVCRSDTARPWCCTAGYTVEHKSTRLTMKRGVSQQRNRKSVVSEIRMPLSTARLQGPLATNNMHMLKHVCNNQRQIQAFASALCSQSMQLPELRWCPGQSMCPTRYFLLSKFRSLIRRFRSSLTRRKKSSFSRAS